MARNTRIQTLRNQREIEEKKVFPQQEEINNLDDILNEEEEFTEEEIAEAVKLLREMK